MSDNTNSLDTQSLSDEDLAKVTGGSGHWDINEENYWQDEYRKNSFHAVESFEDYLLNHFKGSEDGTHMLQARSLWVKSGRPLHIQVRVDSRGHFDVPWAI